MQLIRSVRFFVLILTAGIFHQAVAAVSSEEAEQLKTTLTPVGVAANTTAEQTFTVTGLVAGSAVAVNKPSAQAGLGISGVRVSAANTLAVNFVNVTATTITPAAEAYTVGNFQLPIDTTTGNSFIEQASPALGGGVALVDSLRAALVALGLISGTT